MNKQIQSMLSDECEMSPIRSTIVGLCLLALIVYSGLVVSSLTFVVLLLFAKWVGGLSSEGG